MMAITEICLCTGIGLGCRTWDVSGYRGLMLDGVPTHMGIGLGVHGDGCGFQMNRGMPHIIMGDGCGRVTMDGYGFPEGFGLLPGLCGAVVLVGSAGLPWPRIGAMATGVDLVIIVIIADG